MTKVGSCTERCLASELVLQAWSRVPKLETVSLSDRRGCLRGAQQSQERLGLPQGRLPQLLGRAKRDPARGEAGDARRRAVRRIRERAEFHERRGHRTAQARLLGSL